MHEVGKHLKPLNTRQTLMAKLSSFKMDEKPRGFFRYQRKKNANGRQAQVEIEERAISHGSGSRAPHAACLCYLVTRLAIFSISPSPFHNRDAGRCQPVPMQKAKSWWVAGEEKGEPLACISTVLAEQRHRPFHLPHNHTLMGLD